MDLMVNPDRKVGFRRCVRKSLPKKSAGKPITGPRGKGEILKTLVFEPGKVTSLNARDLEAVGEDIKKGALIEATQDDRGKWRPKEVAVAEEETVTIPKAEYDVLLECAANTREMKEGAKAEGAREAIAAGSNGNGSDAQG